MEDVNLLQRLTISVRKYKYAIMILLLGVALMLIPTGADDKASSDPESVAVATEIPGLEERLEQILSRIYGAGEVQVLLTERRGSETLFQSDRDSGEGDSGSTLRENTVIVEDSSNAESALVCRVDPPEYLGAVIVCQGGDDPTVKLAIVEAVRCATGLGADQISVMKMK